MNKGICEASCGLVRAKVPGGQPLNLWKGGLENRTLKNENIRMNCERSISDNSLSRTSASSWLTAKVRSWGGDELLILRESCWRIGWTFFASFFHCCCTSAMISFPWQYWGYLMTINRYLVVVVITPWLWGTLIHWGDADAHCLHTPTPQVLSTRVDS